MYTTLLINDDKILSSLLSLLANSINTKRRPSQANILSCKIIIETLDQGAHCFVIFFITNMEQVIV